MLPTPLLIDDADHGRGERRLAEVGYVADREPMPRSARPRPTLCLLGYTKCILLLFAESANQSFMDEEIKTKLTIAWRAAAARLIDAGYEPRDVYATMTSVALSGAGGQANDNPPPVAAKPMTKRPMVPFREA